MEGFPHMDTESCNEEFADFAVGFFFFDNIMFITFVHQISLIPVYRQLQ